MGIRYILLFSQQNKSGELFMPDIFKAAAAPIKEQEPQVVENTLPLRFLHCLGL